jgi:hypothetical protein
MAREDRRCHLISIDDETESLPNPYVVKRGRVRSHDEGRPVPRLGTEELRLGVALHLSDEVRRNTRDRFHLPAQECVDTSGVVVDVDDHDLVEQGLPAPPVVRVSDHDALATGGKAL